MNQSGEDSRWQKRQTCTDHPWVWFLLVLLPRSSYVCVLHFFCFLTHLPLVCSVLVLSLLCVLYLPPSSCTRVEIGGKSVRLNKAPLCLCCVCFMLHLVNQMMDSGVFF